MDMGKWKMAQGQKVQEVSIVDEEAIPARQHAQAHFAEAVREAVDRLPRDLKRIILGKYEERKSLRRLAQEMGIPYTTVKVLHRDAKSLLRLFLQGDSMHTDDFLELAVNRIFQGREFISGEDLVKALQISSKTIYRAVKTGELPAVRVGNSREFRFTREAVRKFLKVYDRR